MPRVEIRFSDRFFLVNDSHKIVIPRFSALTTAPCYENAPLNLCGAKYDKREYFIQNKGSLYSKLYNQEEEKIFNSENEKKLDIKRGHQHEGICVQASRFRNFSPPLASCEKRIIKVRDM